MSCGSYFSTAAALAAPFFTPTTVVVFGALTVADVVLVVATMADCVLTDMPGTVRGFEAIDCMLTIVGIFVAPPALGMCVTTAPAVAADGAFTTRRMICVCLATTGIAVVPVAELAVLFTSCAGGKWGCGGGVLAVVCVLDEAQLSVDGGAVAVGESGSLPLPMGPMLWTLSR